MDNSSSVNDQVTDAISQLNTLLISSSAPQSLALLDVAGAESMGMAMHNAVSNQHNAQISSGAAITSVCAKMLQIPSEPFKPKAPDSSENRVIPPFLPLDNEPTKSTTGNLVNKVETLVKDAESINPDDLQKVNSLIAELQNILSMNNSNNTASQNSEQKTTNIADDNANDTVPEANVEAPTEKK